MAAAETLSAMSGRRFKKYVALLTLLAVIALPLCAPVVGQVANGARPKRRAEGTPAPDVARWQYLLDDLAREARTLTREETVPPLLAEVADAYWDLDQVKSRELFTTAMEAALSLKPDAKGASGALRQVITLATKRDAALARGLSEKIFEAGAKGRWATEASVSAAVDLLETDPAAAARLAEAQAPAGPSMDSAWLIVQLGARDAAAADRVYGAYLGRFAPETGFGLERLLWLAGYPFGHAESFGGALKPSRLVGFSGMRSPVLTARPELAQAFLDVALRASQDALRRAGSAEPQRAEALNELVLFTAAYLLPEVRRYRPQAVPLWAQVEQQAQAGASVPEKDFVAKRVQEIFGSRPRPGQQPGELYAAGRAEDLLAEAEKLPGGCKRNTQLAQAALSISHGKDFSRALEVSGRVESESLRESVRQFLYYDMAYAALKRGDAVGLEDAQKYAELVTPSEQRALLYVKIATAALKLGDRQLASALLGKTMRLTETISEPAAQASILLAAAAGFAAFDAYDGYKALTEAVKIVNRAKTLNVEDFRVLRKVNLACRAGEDSWYGDSDKAERFSLFETFARIAAADADGALSLARDLDEPSTRIRSLISIARSMTKRQRPGSPSGTL